jgi:PAS domain S-box-containing protein
LFWGVIVQISKALFDLLDALKDSIIALDSEMNIVYVNNSQAVILNSKPSQIIGKNIYEVAPQIAQKILNQKILKTITRQEITSVEWQSVYNTDLWRTTIFPADDGIAMISRAVMS